MALSSNHPTTTSVRGAIHRANLRYGLTAALLALGSYTLIYLPYGENTWLARLLRSYLELLAQTTGRVIQIFEGPIAVHGTVVGGRFPIEIVLDCGALDVMALYLAAVLPFPVGWRERAIGVGAGLAALFGLNLLRLVTLGLVGVHAPEYFHVMHEEVFQVVLVLATLALFGVWLHWIEYRKVA